MANSGSAVHSGTRSGNPGRLGDDPTLVRYLRALDVRDLMSAEREAAAASELRALKIGYWRRLLSVRSVLPEILVALGDRLPADVRASVGRAQSRRELDDETLARVADVMVDADPGCERADRLAADVHALAAGGPCGELHVARRPRRDVLRRESAQLNASRAAWSTARQSFVAANLRLVVTMARRFEASGRLPLTDLIQEGNLGLMTAADRFDPRRGFRFSTYAAWWIRHTIGRALSDRGRTVRLPVHVIELQIRVARLRRDFERSHGRPPEQDELARLAEVPPEKLVALERTLCEVVSIPKPAGDDGIVSGLDALPDPSTPDCANLLHDERLQRELGDALGELAPSQLRILRMRFGLDGNEAMTLREVGETHSLSRERIRQLQEAALRVLRQSLERRGFARADLIDELAC